MEPNIGDDASKKKRQTKRDCAEVVEQHASKLRKYSPTTTEETAVSSKIVKTTATTATSSNTPTTSRTIKAAADVPASVIVTQTAAASEAIKASVKATPRQQSPSSDAKERSSNETTTEARQVANHPTTAGGEIVGKQDLESALHYVVTIGEGRSEPLSDDTTLSFRVGHAGDASTLATWYRNSASGNNNDASSSTLGSSATNDCPGVATGGTDEKTKEDSAAATSSKIAEQKQVTDDETPSPDQAPATGTTTTCLDQGGSSSLDLWLVDGLGDEDIPPSLFALIADVNTTTTTNNNKSSQKMAAVALLTSSWEHSSRVLRLEWFQIDDSLDHSKLVERRMWLRLSLLSLVTSSELRVVDPSTNAITATTATTSQTQIQLQP